jgi:hypothetical protein
MVPFLCPYQFKIQTMNPLNSLRPIQTKLYHTEISLSESWRDRSKTQSGFDVASVTASAALGKLQSANNMEKNMSNDVEGKINILKGRDVHVPPKVLFRNICINI